MANLKSQTTSSKVKLKCSCPKRCDTAKRNETRTFRKNAAFCSSTTSSQIKGKTVFRKVSERIQQLSTWTRGLESRILNQPPLINQASAFLMRLFRSCSPRPQPPATRAVATCSSSCQLFTLFMRDKETTPVILWSLSLLVRRIQLSSSRPTTIFSNILAQALTITK